MLEKGGNGEDSSEVTDVSDIYGGDHEYGSQALVGEEICLEKGEGGVEDEATIFCIGSC